ncbi:MAG: hypothetical protein IT208_14170 [Chthonomonadales bacterium]|nr:hypothetical protein [Chthonomonadales bacterium]
MADTLALLGGARSFTGEYLREVAFPLGGIGTGTVSLGGRGNLRDWEIFNRPGKGRILPYTFFALWARRRGHPPVARVLERQLLPPYSSGFGLPTALVSGLPRLREATFRAIYPLARIDFEDDTVPLRIALEAWNPFVPMDDRASGVPAAVFRWLLTNDGAEPTEAAVCFSLLNACGYNGTDPLGNRHNPLFGANVNEFRRADGLAGLALRRDHPAADDPCFGTMAIATPAPEVTWLTRWERAGWWDDVQSFWDDFATDGGLPDGPEPDPSPDGQTDVGSIAARVVVHPGATVAVPFSLAWHFPNLANHWNTEQAVKGRRLGNWYARQWPDAWAVLADLHATGARLEAQTRAYIECMASSTLPPAAIDAASANASILRTTTVLRTEDGRLNGFEGCGDSVGCCPMNCTHVWNYEQTVAHLFPTLERTVRETDFGHNTRSDGSMAFRTLLPLIGELWAFKPAADGQMGTIMKVYREWLQSGDRAFLERMWPGVERALEFAWRPGGWDPNRDGVMEGEQHNTYDIEFYGPNTMMGTLYLGALRAAEEMADALGLGDAAARYRAVYESGRARHAETLWNGEYFVQRVVPPASVEGGEGVHASAPASLQAGEAEPRYQYGPGCLSDHLLGQWFARVVGLGDLLPPEMVRSAIHAVYRHNFRDDLSEHASVQRVYALNEESGLLLCTWPTGGRPRYPFPYADEVWTGIEYQVAAHLIYEGFVDEGMAIVMGARARHDGERRNPWDEFECGHHYARAMSSWSLILALSGYHYDASRGLLAFDPRVSPEDFRCFYSAGTAWGSFRQRREAGAYEAAVEVRWGHIDLRALRLPVGAAARVMAEAAGAPAAASLTGDLVRFAEPVTLRAGQTLTLRAER